MAKRMLIEKNLAYFDVICSTSRCMAREASKYTQKSIEIVPFGVDTDLFRPSASSRPKNIIEFGIAKALDPKYGIDVLLSAFKAVHEKMPLTRLVIIGTGPFENKYKAMCTRMGLDNYVSWMGYMPNTDVAKALKDMDIFVVPSQKDSESFGVAAVEAMAAGLPVLVSDAAGLVEVTENKKTGFVFERQDVQELTRLMLLLASTPEMRENLGRAGREHVIKYYAWEENVSSMVRIYQNILDNRPTAISRK